MPGSDVLYGGHFFRTPGKRRNNLWLFILQLRLLSLGSLAIAACEPFFPSPTSDWNQHVHGGSRYCVVLLPTVARGQVAAVVGSDFGIATPWPFRTKVGLVMETEAHRVKCHRIDALASAEPDIAPLLCGGWSPHCRMRGESALATRLASPAAMAPQAPHPSNPDMERHRSDARIRVNSSRNGFAEAAGDLVQDVGHE